MTVLITRARVDAEPLAEQLAGKGIPSLIDPLLDIKFLDGPELDLTGVQGLLATSANGIRAFCHRSSNRALPVYAVGDASAREARQLGFESVQSASGDVDALADLVVRVADPGRGPLIHAAGTKIAGDLAGLLANAGFSCRREVLYEAVTAEALQPETVTAIKQNDIGGVMMYSPRTAAQFCALARFAGVEDRLSDIDAFCLSENVARAARGVTWRHIFVAARPEQDALMSLLPGSQ